MHDYQAFKKFKPMVLKFEERNTFYYSFVSNMLFKPHE